MLRSRGFVFGFGAAFIFLSIVFFAAYKIAGSENKQPEEIQVTIEMTDEEIIARARELGLTDEVKEVVVEKEAELSENEIIEKAAELGMVFVDPDEIAADETLNVSDAQVSIEVPVETAQAEKEYVTIRIAGGLTAIRIAKLLADNGVVDDAGRFQDYLIAERATTSLRAGTLVFPIGASYEEALAVLNKRIVY